MAEKHSSLTAPFSNSVSRAENVPSTNGALRKASLVDSATLKGLTESGRHRMKIPIRSQKKFKFSRFLALLYCFLVIRLFCSLPKKSSLIAFDISAKDAHSGLTLYSTQKYLVVNCVSGFGNRVRACVSAVALARLMHRQLIVVWMPDAHCGATWAQLFDAENFEVYGFDLLPQLPADETYVYDFTKEKPRTIFDEGHKYIYVKSLYKLSGRGGLEVTEEIYMSHLHEIRPSEAVSKIVSRVKSTLPDSRNIVGMHIRVEDNVAVDVPNMDPKNSLIPVSALTILHHERNRCRASSFLLKIKHRLSVRPDTIFWASIDSNKTWDDLSHSDASQRIRLMDEYSYNKCLAQDRRSATCVQHAFAEILLLSIMEEFWYSEWSSFSELVRAIRISNGLNLATTGCSSVVEKRGSLLRFFGTRSFRISDLVF